MNKVLRFPSKGGTEKGKGKGRGKGGGGAPPAPPGERDALEAAIDDVNREFALVLVGDKALVLHETTDARNKHKVGFLTVTGFKTWLENRRFYDPDIERQNGLGSLWVKHKKRLEYKGVDFAPDGVPEGWYNLWRGFALDPAPAYDDYLQHVKHFPTLFDHVLKNLARGNVGHAKYIWAWSAHMFQRPTERIGVALVLRGKQGVGKTTLGEVLGSLLGPHYTLIDDPKHLVGSFNSHMASCLFLQADEAVWAGDKQAEGKLKSLVTSSVHLIEKKGVDAVPIRNLIRLMMTSNNDWVVPAGPEERRFPVFDVGDGCMQDRAYFAKLHYELDHGGREHLLAYLLGFPLDEVDLNTLPRTEALFEQKVNSFEPHVAWWYDCLRRGGIVANQREWPYEAASEAVYRSYETYAERLGVRRKLTPAQLGIALRKLVPPPGLKAGKVYVEDPEYGPAGEVIHNADGSVPRKRVNGYALPGLTKCRKAFEAFVRHDGIEWPDDDLHTRPEDGGQAGKDGVPF